ncbi:MAG TPA: hypothetical protein VK668_11980 [Mucilaginibacter sp.]|nr:hypothetical protein [Mucilaginibacter sp.]
MKKILLIALLFVVSCTEKMPDNLKAESAVKRYLDSNYKDSKVEITGFKDFMSVKNYFEQEKKEYFQRPHPNIPEKARASFKKEMDKYYADEINRHKGSVITCFYEVDNKKHEDNCWIEPDFKTVHIQIIVE